ncbi:hypothetical protein PVK06_008652 [Gossypium arboreum]|uniref:Uncharacterized protein n=1 Tax=Gossypium arboreum TaxID=29729 RepID=A0ABR0QLQ3_GOSAR|nr:hypothetical protein PVK06_008652 [Gossypium arboreum]
MDAELMLDTHCSIGNAILELYTHIIYVEEGGPSLAIVSVNLFQEHEAESPTIWFCSGFTALLQSLYQEMLESPMRRHSSILTFDFNFGIHSGLVGTPLSYTGGKSISNIGFNIRLVRTDDVLPTIYTGEGTFNPSHEIVTRVDNKEKAENKEEIETDDNSIQESRRDGLKISLFFKLEVVPTKLEKSDSDNKGSDNAGGTQLDFMA